MTPNFLLANSLADYINICTNTHLNNARGHDGDDKIEPDVGEDAPEGSDEEHAQVFDLPHLTIRDYEHTDCDDHEHVKGCAAHDCARAELTRLEAVPTHLNTHKHTILQ